MIGSDLLIEVQSIPKSQMKISCKQSILVRAMNIAIVTVMLITSFYQQALSQTLTPILYFPMILPAPPNLRITQTYFFGRRDSQVVNGEFVSNVDRPIYDARVQLTTYDANNEVIEIVTQTAFLPVTYPDQVNAFAIHSGGYYSQAYRIVPDLVGGSFTSTETYLRPSTTFTSPFISGGNTVEHIDITIVNDTGITLTDVTIAGWSVRDPPDGVEGPRVTTISQMAPGEIAILGRQFSYLILGVPLNSVRVAAQGIASP